MADRPPPRRSTRRAARRGLASDDAAEVQALLCAPGAPFEMETVTIAGVPTRCWKNQPPSLACSRGWRAPAIATRPSSSTRTSASATRAGSAPPPRSPPNSAGSASARATASRWRCATCPNGPSSCSRSPASARSWCRSTRGGRGRSSLRARPFGGQAAGLRRAALGAHPAASRRTARSRAGDRRARGRRARRTRDRARIDHRHAARLWRPARRRPARGRDRARRRCDALLHQRHHRPPQGRARHASQHPHLPDRRVLCQPALGAAPRRGADAARAQGRADRHPDVPRHRVQRLPDGRRWRPAARSCSCANGTR